MHLTLGLEYINTQGNIYRPVFLIRFKNLCLSHVGILSWGNLINTNS